MSSGNHKIGFLSRVSQAASLIFRGADPRLVTKGVDSMGGGFQGVPAYWFARAIEVGGQETLFEPFKNSVWVQRAIKTVAGPVSSVPVMFFSARDEATGYSTSGRAAQGPKSRKMGRVEAWKRGRKNVQEEEALDLPAVEAFLREPAMGLGYADFVEASVGWLKLRGETFWLLTDDLMVPFPEARKGPGGRPPQIIIARPDRMRHIIENGELTGWSFNDADGKTFALLPEQVIQIKYWNPYDKWRGLGEYEPAHIATEADWLAGKFARNLMSNNGDTGPYIVAKTGVPTDAQREQIIADLKAKRQAQLRGDFRPIFMSGDITVEDPQVRSVDSSFVAQRLENRHEIYLAFGVPPSLADVKAAYSIGSASDFYQLISNTCVPTGEKFCDGLERLVAKLFDLQVEAQLNWDDHPVFQEVRKERLASIDTLANRGMPMRDISDYLGLDLPEFEGDKIGYLPINVTPAGDVTAEPEPSTDPALAENDQSAQANDNPIKSLIAAIKSPRKTKNHLLWEKKMRARVGVVRAYTSKVTRLLSQYRATALKKLATHGGTKGLASGHEEKAVTKSIVDFIFDPVQFGKELVMSINPVTQLALQTAGSAVLDELGRKDDPWKMAPAKALEYIRGREQPVMGCGETARAQLNTALQEGIAKGETMDQLEDRVRSVFNALAKGEAKRIAVTETGAAFNFAGFDAMKYAGVEYKAWLSSHGPNVRPAHAEAELRYMSNPIPIDEPFVVDGEELDYPMDPAGSPENVINCHCEVIAVAAPKGEKE